MHVWDNACPYCNNNIIRRKSGIYQKKYPLVNAGIYNLILETVFMRGASDIPKGKAVIHVHRSAFQRYRKRDYNGQCGFSFGCCIYKFAENKSRILRLVRAMVGLPFFESSFFLIFFSRPAYPK